MLPFWHKRPRSFCGPSRLLRTPDTPSRDTNRHRTLALLGTADEGSPRHGTSMTFTPSHGFRPASPRLFVDLGTATASGTGDASGSMPMLGGLRVDTGAVRGRSTGGADRPGRVGRFAPPSRMDSLVTTLLASPRHDARSGRSPRARGSIDLTRRGSGLATAVHRALSAARWSGGSFRFSRGSFSGPSTTSPRAAAAGHGVASASSENVLALREGAHSPRAQRSSPIPFSASFRSQGSAGRGEQGGVGQGPSMLRGASFSSDTGGGAQGGPARLDHDEEAGILQLAVWATSSSTA